MNIQEAITDFERRADFARRMKLHMDQRGEPIVSEWFDDNAFAMLAVAEELKGALPPNNTRTVAGIIADYQANSDKSLADAQILLDEEFKLSSDKSYRHGNRCLRIAMMLRMIEE